MADFAALMTKENILRSRLDRFIENGRKTATIKRTQGFYESRITDLKSLWEEYCAVDLAINQELLQSKDDNSDYLKEDRFGIADLKYSEYIGELVEGLRKFAIPTEQNVVNPLPIHTTTVVHQESSLPKITIPKYSGDYDLWRSFHDLFDSLVHKNTKLTAVQKLYHLKSCLTGDAEKLLRHTPITEADYEPAWLKLKERYENKRILVNHQLKILINQPKITVEKPKDIKELIDTTDECLQQLKCLEVETDSWDVLLIHLLVHKLPFLTLRLWEEEQGTTQDLPKYKTFNEFLQKRLKILEAIADTVKPNPSHRKPGTKETSYTHLITEKKKCPACDGKHFVVGCKRYQQLTTNDRWKVIKAAGRCTNCFSSNHMVKNCVNKNRCFKCKSKHHTSLHDGSDNGVAAKQPSYNKQHTEKSNALTSNALETDRTKNNSETNPNRSESQMATSNEDDSASQVFVARKDHQTLLSTALVRAQSEDGEIHILRCLLDTGSQSSFVSEDACKKLRAPSTHTSITITGLNTSQAAVVSKKTTLKLRSCGFDKTVLSEDLFIIKQITEALPTRTVAKADCKHLKGLTLADPHFWKPGRIDVLLGAQTFAKIIQEGIRKGPPTAPVALNTIFGWILLGSTNRLSTDNAASFTITTSETKLESQLKKFWEIEEVSMKPMLTDKEEECQKIYESTTTRLSNGKYQVHLPFINNQMPTVGQSRPQAITRYNQLQRRLAANPSLAIDYRKCLQEYWELEHMEAVDPPDVGEPCYYIPHHAVLKESTTTKLRVVFDASAKTTNGNALNDYLLKGPTLQPKLYATLLNWRKYKVALNADIEKMYRMIEVHPNHRKFQRIIWEHPTSKEMQDFQLKTVTFGTSAAPYLAIRTLQQLAKDESHNWPRAAVAVYNAFYVDDLLTGADTITEAKELQNELINMMNAGGFNLRKWSSNEAKLLEDLPVEFREPRSERFFTEDESMKALGIRWHPASDFFSFKVTPKPDNIKSTKRTILSEIATLYDPLGWLAPVLITAKILMQVLWITGSSWDTPVADSIQEQWNDFKQNLQNIQCITIPRWINYSTKATVQLHGFCDASERAYAAVIYMRVTMENGQTTCHLLTAKTRVAPTKPVTIPRLELNGGVLLARLLKTTVIDMQLVNVPIYAWTDSTIVLQWIKEHPSRWKTYVANRVVEIQDVVRYENWRHVPTKMNPADLASRGVSVSQLQYSDLWWYGPDWLVKDHETWPGCQINLEQTSHEARLPKVTNLLSTANTDILTRYSSFVKLIRIIATMKRFVFNCKYPSKTSRNQLSCDELNAAETTILRLVQQETFQDEYNCITNNKSLPRNSKLLQLNPFIDTNDLMRVGGRLENAMMSYSRKHPIIMPQNHHVTTLIINKLHQDTLHGGTAAVLNASRDKYWILNSRRCITSTLHKCVICAKQRSTLSTQLMGNLPAPRVNITKAFAKVGIDFAGPIITKSSTLRNAKQQKSYVCIFVCMATKAIHIELVSDLTSISFVAALKRFVARRGICSDIYSDCGTNFIGANTLLQKEYQQCLKDQQEIGMQYATSRGIKWHFNPPASPHFGGLWEAGVKSMKYHLRRVLGNTICTFEECSTLLTQIEACLNSRPLCYIHNNPEELFVLTPGHFLIGQALTAIPEPHYETDKILPSQRWKYIQLLTQHFWDKWSKDYLNQLQNRPKWQVKKPNIQPGELVLLKSEQMHPTCWPIGVIEKIFPGQDGLVRVVQLRTKHGTFQRPVAKLCRLPIDTM